MLVVVGFVWLFVTRHHPGNVMIFPGWFGVALTNASFSAE
jgi:hypothetical protein